MRARLALPAAIVAVLLSSPLAAAATAPEKTWATVNVCDTVASPNTIGLRGSMPGIALKKATMWMRFQVQYRTAEKTWKAATGLDTGFLSIGAANVTSRESGRSFTVKPPAAGGAFILRGVVSFQWRSKRGTVVRSDRRITSAGHKSTAGADPPGYSAATCTIA